MEQVFINQILLYAQHTPAFKSTAQLTHGEQEITFLSDVLHLAIEPESGSGNNAMHMWVQAQVLSPGVQHANGPCLDPKAGVSERFERIPNRGKEQIVKAPCIEHTQPIKLVRQGKHDVIMLHIERSLEQILDPKGLLGSQTLWTMSVSATVIAVALGMAPITLVNVSTQRSCSAFR
jgi:hypothetical protein